MSAAVRQLQLLSVCIYHHVFTKTHLSLHCLQPRTECRQSVNSDLFPETWDPLMGKLGSKILHQPDRKLLRTVFYLVLSPQTPFQMADLHHGLKLLPANSCASHLSFIFPQVSLMFSQQISCTFNSILVSASWRTQQNACLHLQSHNTPILLSFIYFAPVSIVIFTEFQKFNESFLPQSLCAEYPRFLVYNSSSSLTS